MLNVARSVLMMGLAFTLTACGDEDEKPAPEVASPGEQIWKANCKVCHAQGINGAPILGNKAMWGPRLEQGEATLVEHAINGFGLMPAKGGKADLPDSDVKLAVQFMVSKVQ